MVDRSFTADQRLPAPSLGNKRWLGTLACLLLAVIASFLAGCAPAAPTPASSDSAALAEQKLTQEVRKLRFETDRASSALGVALAVGPFVTVLVAVLAFGLSAVKQVNDRAKDRTSRQDQQDKDRQSRKDEQAKDRRSREDEQAKDRQLRFDTLFTTATAQIAAADEGLQAAGAASLLRLQDSAEDRMQKEIVLYCATQLRIGLPSKARPILKEVLAAALRRASTVPFDGDDAHRLKVLNLEGADLTQIDLTGISLRGVRLEFAGADLSEAVLSGADLWGLRAWKTDFQKALCVKTNFGPARLSGSNFDGAQLPGARLSSAELRDSEISHANFRGAQLQAVHFDRSRIVGSTFEGADINDAYFNAAVLAGGTRESLLRARHRDKAHGLPPMGQRCDSP